MTANLLKMQPSTSSEERQSNSREVIMEESIFSAKNSPSTSLLASPSSSISSSSSPSLKDKSKFKLEGIVKKHRLEDKRSKAGPLKNIGIVLKKDKKKDDDDSEAKKTEESNAVIDSAEDKAQAGDPKEGGSGTNTTTPGNSNPLSLCDYGSSTDDSE